MALFVTLEGGEGAGKTSVAAALADRSRARGAEVVQTHEPGATPLGAALRASIFRADERISGWTEAFLFLADRADHVQRVVRPALARGAVVICDRFSDSTIAYQGYGRGLDLDLLQQLNREAAGGTVPNLTLLLNIPLAQGLARSQPETFDRIGREATSFHARMHEGFGRLAMAEPDRIKSIDAGQPLDAVIEDAWAFLEPRLARIGFPTPR
jgi:dTMP kinase